MPSAPPPPPPLQRRPGPGSGTRPRPRPRPRPAPIPPDPPAGGEYPSSTEARPLSRRSLLGLGALAGAGAGAIVAGGIMAGQDSSATVVDGNGAPVITTDPQHLSVASQQQAARNIGAVRTVEPEQFDGSTDDEQLANAFAALRGTGGEIRLRPGKTYVWKHAMPTVNWAGHGPIVIHAWGAVVQYAGTGSAFTSTQSRTPAGIQTLSVFGGSWIAPKADAFFRIEDSDNHLFYRCRGEVPNGTMFALSNVKFWSERNHFIEIEDHNCREVVRFSVDGSSHASFARTLVKDLRLQGGTAGYPKINVITKGDVLPSPYDSVFDGIVGNVSDGVIVQRLAGALSGTTISGIQVESPDGSSTAAIWQVGDLVGYPPLLLGGPPILRNLRMFTADSISEQPFGATVALGGVAAGAALSGTAHVIDVVRAGEVTIPGELCNVATVRLHAPCTASAITARLSTGDTQSLTVAFAQTGVGGFTYAWPSNCRFAKGLPPSDTTAGTQTSVTFAFVAGLWLETARAEAVPIV